jgi:hypothetical protein
MSECILRVGRPEDTLALTHDKGLVRSADEHPNPVQNLQLPTGTDSSSR